jgi:hypothetical protein
LDTAKSRAAFEAEEVEAVYEQLLLESYVRRPDPDEQSREWQESLERHNARVQEENRQAWAEYHRCQAHRMRTLLEALVARHEERAQQLLKGDT